ncbi:hypothetical protein PsAD2_02555 [Pseudovibrio axinellae]|uniref:Uncharacterized protein n=1 Tax=Pseudovibrio axinellae TaxID=989403 RepID=A0A165YAH7_9HYPH|nr:hypothetical protein [Pseudovibrio axinellae]KZL18614.1 hypothetical protein PsAD2_02555 [Pseudovibrio axinellae]SER74430.1 hypothetical protein SAMN05421798_11933 [Pseudovibrio axinellae]
MIDFEKYNRELDPAMLLVIEESLKIFPTVEHFEQWIDKKWEIVNKRNKTYNNGSKGCHYQLKSLVDPILFFKITLDDSNCLHFSDPSCNLEAAYYICDQLRKNLPDLDGKLIFVDEYGSIARFPFDCSDDELCLRIGLDGDFHDRELMQEFGLE